MTYPSLLSWRFLRMQLQSDDIVELIWADEEGVQNRSVVRADYDIDGVTFWPESEPGPDADVLDELEHDMAMLDGSQYIPIKPAYYQKAV